MSQHILLIADPGDITRRSVRRVKRSFTDAEFQALPLIGKYGITQGTGVRVVHLQEGEDVRGSCRSRYLATIPEVDLPLPAIRRILREREKIERERRHAMRYGVQNDAGEIVASAPTRREITLSLAEEVRRWRYAARPNTARKMDRAGTYFRLRRGDSFVTDLRVIRIY